MSAFVRKCPPFSRSHSNPALAPDRDSTYGQKTGLQQADICPRHPHWRYQKRGSPPPNVRLRTKEADIGRTRLAPAQDHGVQVGIIGRAPVSRPEELQAIVESAAGHPIKLRPYGREQGISWLGLSHYSSERFACEALTRYFRGMGLPAVFLADQPGLADMD